MADADGDGGSGDADGGGPASGDDREATPATADGPTLAGHEAILPAIGDPIYVQDPNGRITDVNDALVDLTGYDREQLVGESVSKLFDDAAVQRSREVTQYLLAGSPDDSHTMETTLETADDDRRTCEIRISIVADDGSFDGVVGVVRDVTEQRRREEQLAVMDRVLRHNLRNKMNVVLGRAREIQGGGDPEMTDHHADAIAEVARELLSLGETARRFDEMSVEGDGERIVVDLADLVPDRVPSSSDYDQAAFFVDAPDEAIAKVDPAVGLAVEELVQNSLRHFDGIALVVRVTLTVEDEWIELTIEDNGPGIPDHDRLVLEEGTETELRHGSGLGLWVVSWIVERSGGRLEYEDNDPTGAVMHLSFPRADGDEDEELGV